ncbi:MAG TPA: hypothetical protein VKA68_04840, partial [bacterium]|nr:hypothetical protein [bacterium]
NADSAGYEETLANGYYTMAIQLTDTGDVVWGVVEGARVLAGELAHRTYQLTTDVNRGGLDLAISDSLANPIEITLSGAVAELTEGNSMTVNATTSEPVDSYQWYLQGATLSGETGSSVTVGSTLSPATYWLSLVVTEDGIVSSESVEFEVVAASPGIAGTETRITPSTASQNLPGISGEKIVWQDDRDASQEIYMYDLSTDTETRITTNSAEQYRPAVSGDIIVWSDWQNDNADIFQYDISTSTISSITTAFGLQEVPDIDGNRVVWREGRNDNWDIYTYDLSTDTESAVTTHSVDQYQPAVSGDRVMWSDDRNGNYDIFMYNLATDTEVRLTTESAEQSNPAISGNHIVWQDERNGDSDIYLFTIAP